MANNNPQKTAAFLVRCSTDKQDYDRQVQDLAVVAERFNLLVSDKHIYGEYITGRDDVTKKTRLSITRLMNAAKKKEFDYILVAEVSRLSRDSLSGRYYVREFCNLHIPVYFRDKMKWTMNIDTLAIDESFIKELGLYFDGAAEYLKSMKTQIASGRRASLRNNQLVVGHPPIGYKKRGGTDKHHKSELIIDDRTAQMVKDIFSLYLEEGASLKSVSLAISTKYGIRKTVSGVQQILARPEYYTGEYTIFMRDPDNIQKEPEPFIIKFEPLIDKQTFDAVRMKRKENKSSRTPYPQQKVFPLSRLILCPFCNHHFSPRVRTGDKEGEKYRLINGQLAYSWLCTTRINNAGDCLSHINLNNEKLEGIIWGFIKKELLDFADPHKDSREEKIAQLRKEINEATNMIPDYEAQIGKAKQEAQKAHEIFLMATEVFPEEAKNNYLNALKKAKKATNDYTREIDHLVKLIKTKENTIAYFQNASVTPDYLKKLEKDSAGKRQLFLQLIEAIRCKLQSKNDPL